MVNYTNSKIVSFGVKNHIVGVKNHIVGDDTFLFATTLSKSLCKAYILKKYRDYKFCKAKQNTALPYFENNKIPNDKNNMFSIIERVKPENLYCYVVDENQTIQNKKQFNQYFKLYELLISHPIEHVIKQNKPEIKDTSVNRYVENLKHLMKQLNTQNPLFFTDTTNVLNYIKIASGWSIETQKNYLKAVISYIPPLNNNYTIYNTELKLLIDIAQNERDKNLKSDTQREHWIEYDEILKKYNELEKNGISLELVICSFYVGIYFAPYRMLELEHLKIQNVDKDKDNYIDFDKQTIVLNIYKTVKDYGKREQRLPTKLFHILTEYTKFLLSKNPDATYLLTVKNKKPSYYTIHKFLMKIFGCSASLLRNIYVSHLYHTNKLNTGERIKKIAYEMRNSPTVLQTYIKLQDGTNETDKNQVNEQL